jgi:hypothetical protein
MSTKYPEYLRVATPIRAEITGSDACTALGTAVHGTAPVLKLCELLVAAGHDPAARLEAYRGDTLCLKVRTIGEGARLRVAPHGVGFECLPACTAAPPMRQTGVPGAGPCQPATPSGTARGVAP